jgi:hypothetical protein
MNAGAAVDTDRDRAWTVSERSVAVFAVGLVAAALCSRWLDAEHAATAALKVVTASLAVGFVPGVLITLLARPRPLSMLELAGFGIAISFGLTQLLTILAISTHVGPVVPLTLLLMASALVGALVIRRGSGTIVVTPDELIVLALICAVGWSAYAVGSPVDWNEDQIHLAIARRLSELESPRLDTLYVTPGIVYTYPFPGIHYFIGLIARLGEIDTLFLYHKLRFFWGLAVLLMIHLAARAVFGLRGVAAASAVTAAVLVWSGVFAMGFTTGWGHLVPYSHVSDVAMGVLLPCLLVVAFAYLQSESSREQWYFVSATAALALMVTMVHMREIVQFAVYLTCFALVAAAHRGFRPYLGRTVTLLTFTLASAALYAAWQGRAVPLVSDIVQARRLEMVTFLENSSPRELLLEPASTMLSGALHKFEEIYNGLLPLFLFGGPLVVVLFRHRPLVWLIASSTVAYLLLMSVPVFAAAYVYATYFEMLHLPVRNVIFFVYVTAGVLLYAGVVALARVDRTRLSLLVAGVLGGAFALLTILCLNRSHWGFAAPLAAAYGMTFLCLGEGSVRRRVAMAGIPAALVALAGLLMLWPDRSPVQRSEQVSVRWHSELSDERRVAFEGKFSLAQGEPKPDRADDENVWNYRVTDLSVENIRGIVTHPDVLDTHFIDRSTFRVQSQPPPGHLPLGVQYVTWMQYPGVYLFAGTAVLVWMLGLAMPVGLAAMRSNEALSSFETALRAPFYRHALPFALFLLPFALWTAQPSASPLTTALSEPAGRWSTPRGMVDGLPCVTVAPAQARFTEELFPDDPVMLPERTMCPPSASLIEWIRSQVPVNAVFAIDRWDTYPTAMFSPQQVDVFPSLDASFAEEEFLFRQYYRFFFERMRQYRVQPFFNSVESPDERDAFVRALGVTHVLVNPAHYDELRPVLDGLPGQFELRYADEPWAIYEVKARGLR